MTVDYDRTILAVYLNDPRVTREAHRRTELCIPVIPISTQGSDTTQEEEPRSPATWHSSTSAKR